MWTPSRLASTAGGRSDAHAASAVLRACRGSIPCWRSLRVRVWGATGRAGERPGKSGRVPGQRGRGARGRRRAGRGRGRRAGAGAGPGRIEPSARGGAVLSGVGGGGAGTGRGGQARKA